MDTTIKHAVSMVESIWNTYTEHEKKVQEFNKSDSKQEEHEVSSNPPLLNETECGFYHKPSGLYSEGNWHNCLIGTSLVKLYIATKEERFKEAALKLADSIFELNYDPNLQSFNERTHTSYWTHQTGISYIDEHIKPSTEKKFGATASQLIFRSFLLEIDESQRTRFNEVANVFVFKFWDPEKRKWCRSSKETDYFRAVDQAHAILICLRLLKTQNGQGMIGFHTHYQIEELISATRKSLLKDFKYSKPEQALQYVGDKSSNSRLAWHEIWIVLALLLSSKTKKEAQNAINLFNYVVRTLVHDGFIWANSGITSEKPTYYGNDNFLLCTIMKAAPVLNLEIDIPGYSMEKCRKEFASDTPFFIEANIYRGIRLHVQSEYLFALCFDPNDYVSIKKPQKKTRSVSSVAESPELRNKKRQKVKHVDTEGSQKKEEKIPVVVIPNTKED